MWKFRLVLKMTTAMSTEACGRSGFSGWVAPGEDGPYGPKQFFNFVRFFRKYTHYMDLALPLQKISFGKISSNE